MGRHYIDLTGKTLNGGLYIKGVDKTSGGAGKHKKWICICPVCKQEFKTQSNHILLDEIKMCSTCSRKQFNDLSGKKFGKLTVVKRLYEYTDCVKYLCHCDCGETSIVDARNLKAGKIKSCGCLLSSLESSVKDLLIKEHILFETQKSFLECQDKNPLPFDFYIPKLNMLIEIQGQQHFYPIKHFGGEEKFYKQIHHDLLKEEFCEKNGYKLLQIAYYENLEQKINEEIVWPLRKQKD